MNDNLQELNRVEELLKGYPRHLACLCEILFNWNRKIEAKGIFDRHQILVAHFEKQSIGNKIDQVEYVPEHDFIPFKDYFDPVTMPIKKFFSLPNSVHPELLDRDINVYKLKTLEGSRFIAIKALYRPNLDNSTENQKCSILQISNEKNTFLVNMKSLG